MKKTVQAIRQKADAARALIARFYRAEMRDRAVRAVAYVRSGLIDYPPGRERNRRLILLFSLIFILDYLMYCLHTDKNVVDIFPAFPSLVSEREMTVYLPSTDGTTLIAEKRSVPSYGSDARTARDLFEMVARGSVYENTAMAVPVDLFVRKVWMHGRGGKGAVCVFDVEPTVLRPGSEVIRNSEGLFKRALEKTVVSNLPSVAGVMVIEKGIPGTALWEP